MNITKTEFQSFVKRSLDGDLLKSDTIFSMSIFSKNEIEKNKQLVSYIASIATHAELYGCQCHDDCYHGAFKQAKQRFLKKKGRIYHIDLNENLWDDCHYLWLGTGKNDQHRPPHYFGDCYFYVPIENIDWLKIFQIFEIRLSIINAKQWSLSKSGTSKALDIISREDVIVFNLGGKKSIYVPSKYRQRLYLLSQAFSPLNKWKLCDNRIDILFSSREEVKLALDFSVQDYETSLLK